MTDLTKIPTPAALVDLNKLRQNAERLENRLTALGTRLRLHVKTCKSADLALYCMEGKPQPIAAASLEEVEYFAARGFTDIIYAVGIAPAKLDILARLAAQGTKIRIILDNLETARLAAAHPWPFDALVEIDCDGHRGGIAPESPALTRIAALLERAGKKICGVLTHAGSAYELPCPSPAAFKELSRRENRTAKKAAERLQKAGFGIDIISTGSTPTAVYGTDFQGISEVRAGTHVFMDCVMAALGVCREEDFALSILATVIGRRSDGCPVIDAGWTALSCDRGANFDKYGFGLVADVDGVLYPDLKVAALNQEHGLITADGDYPARLAPGSQVRIFPVHACAAAASFAKFHALHNDGRISIWPKCPQR